VSGPKSQDCPGEASHEHYYCRHSSLQSTFTSIRGVILVQCCKLGGQKSSQLRAFETRADLVREMNKVPARRQTVKCQSTACNEAVIMKSDPKKRATLLRNATLTSPTRSGKPNSLVCRTTATCTLSNITLSLGRRMPNRLSPSFVLIRRCHFPRRTRKMRGGRVGEIFKVEARTPREALDYSITEHVR
jgi:hypothetical protein